MFKVPSQIAVAVLDDLQAGVVIVDREYRIVHSNRFMQAWLHRSADEVKGRRCHELIHGQDKVCEDCPVAVSFRDGRTATTTHTGLDAHGQLTHAAITSHPIRSETGEVLYVLEHVTDIGDRVRAERALRESEEKFRGIYAQSPIGIALCDRAGQILEANPAALEILGVHEAGAARNLRLVDDPSLSQETRDSLGRGEPVRFESRLDFELMRSRGELDSTRRSPVHLNIWITPLEDGHGHLVQLQDVTERKRAEQLRDEYVSLISHDLRQPLTVVTSVSDWLRHTLAERGLVPEASKMETILGCTRRMDAMIRDLVESAHFESGRLDLRRGTNDLLQLVLKVARGARESERGRQILVESPDWVPPFSFDADRIERAVANLLTNALKYSARGTPVRVTVRHVGPEVEVLVNDQGIGVAPDEVPHLFERFRRGRKGNGKTEGLGLGLYITRMIVEAHGGRIWVESAGTGGSTFGFALPCADPHQAP